MTGLTLQRPDTSYQTANLKWASAQSPISILARSRHGASAPPYPSTLTIPTKGGCHENQHRSPPYPPHARGCAGVPYADVGAEAPPLGAVVPALGRRVLRGRQDDRGAHRRARR